MAVSMGGPGAPANPMPLNLTPQDPTYGNLLRQYVTQPGSYTGSPGYQFALDQGLAGVNASNSRMRGSGNALAALTKYASGLASQDYGNTLDRLGRFSGQEEQYGLGQQQNADSYALGKEANANTRYATDQATGLGYFNGMNNFTLGEGQNANTAQNNWFNYNLGQGRNANDAASVASNYDLGMGRNNIDWMNAGTNRGDAQSRAYLGDQANRRAWYTTTMT